MDKAKIKYEAHKGAVSKSSCVLVVSDGAKFVEINAYSEDHGHKGCKIVFVPKCFLCLSPVSHEFLEVPFGGLLCFPY